ncbi:hypothetical protein QJS66_06265 [Kocuria rhizophila]|nr:hypothetical protein QJS66_06265 [Kocuria rhizophila]
MLLEKVADAERVSDMGFTALVCAVFRGRRADRRALLEARCGPGHGAPACSGRRTGTRPGAPAACSVRDARVLSRAGRSGTCAATTARGPRATGATPRGGDEQRARGRRRGGAARAGQLARARSRNRCASCCAALRVPADHHDGVVPAIVPRIWGCVPGQVDRGREVLRGSGRVRRITRLALPSTVTSSSPAQCRAWPRCSRA